MKRSRERCIFHGETFRRYGMIMFQPFILCERFFLFPFFQATALVLNLTLIGRNALRPACWLCGVRWAQCIAPSMLVVFLYYIGSSKKRSRSRAICVNCDVICR